MEIRRRLHHRLIYAHTDERGILTFTVFVGDTKEEDTARFLDAGCSLTRHGPKYRTCAVAERPPPPSSSLPDGEGGRPRRVSTHTMTNPDKHLLSPPRQPRSLQGERGAWRENVICDLRRSVIRQQLVHLFLALQFCLLLAGGSDWRASVLLAGACFSRLCWRSPSLCRAPMALREVILDVRTSKGLNSSRVGCVPGSCMWPCLQRLRTKHQP